MTRFLRGPKYDPLKQGHWLLHGATGLLQPLSESFLYRSPAAPRRLTCRLKAVGGESDDGHR